MTATIHRNKPKDIERERLRSVWKEMKSRCNKPSNKSYSRYGGRGISVCDRWQVFANFLEDMAPRPAGHFLDRIDNDGDYEPRNCRWATPQISTENRRCSILVPDGEQKTVLSVYCRKKNLNFRTVVSRLRTGIPIERAIDPTPLGWKGRLSTKDYETIRSMWSRGGITQAEIARQFGVNPSLISRIVSAKRQRRQVWAR